MDNLDNRHRKIAVIIPAFNEEESIGLLIDELNEHVPDLDVILINDGSTDETAFMAKSRNISVLDLPCNLGVGDAVQVGFKYAHEMGYDLVIRIDADGQHPPREIPKLIAAITSHNVDLVVGSRYIERPSYTNTPMRAVGIKLLSFFLSAICRTRITDPTSGFWIVNHDLLYYFANDYPSEYPEPEAIAMMRRHGYRYLEIPVSFRLRTSGTSKIYGWGAVYYMLKVGLALAVNRLRPLNKRFEKSRIRTLHEHR